MSEDPGHKAMLYFLEVLMNSNGPLTISQLAGRFGSRSFSSEMRSAAGGNESGLKKFFLKYPSLFEVNGNMVSLFDSSKATAESSVKPATSGGVTPSGRSLPDVSAEMEGVRYFQNKLMKKEERWVQIRSLAGHLSQASPEVRSVVGPQLDFKKWVLRHPHIFEVQGDLVGLRDGIAAVTAPVGNRNFDDPDLNGLDAVKNMPPKTPPPSRKNFLTRSPGTVRRSKSFSERPTISGTTSTSYESSTITPTARRRNAPVTMTANEYKAVMFLKDIIEKKGPIKVHNITGHFSQAAEGVRNTIGWTKMELEEFLTKNAAVFNVSEDEVVTVNKNAKLNVIITGSRPSGQSIRTLSGRSGKVFHVAKLWGIIDLGKHEHVFFDKSIMRKPVDDLQKHYRVGETLYFNAVLACKTSRAKWRATHVWKENENEPAGSETDLGSDYNTLSPAGSIEDEINRFLPQHDQDNNPFEVDEIPPFQQIHQINGHSGTELNLISDNSILLSSSSSENSSKNTTPVHKPKLIIESRGRGSPEGQRPRSATHVANFNVSGRMMKRYVDTACQTVSTGEIIATQLYQEEHWAKIT